MIKGNCLVKEQGGVMLRKVLQEYREGFRWSRFKETYHYTMLWYYLYLFGFFPIILDINEKAERIAGYYLAMVPLMLGMYSVSAIPIRLPKQMFLCPLTKEERRKYVKLLFLVRYLGTVIPGMIAYVIAGVLNFIPMVMLPVQLLGLIVSVLCVSITTWPGSTWERNDTKKVRLKAPELKGLYPITVIGLILSAMLQFLQPFELFDPTSESQWIFLGIYCVVVVVFGILPLRYIKAVLDLTIVYENSYSIVGKETKQA